MENKQWFKFARLELGNLHSPVRLSVGSPDLKARMKTRCPKSKVSLSVCFSNVVSFKNQSQFQSRSKDKKDKQTNSAEKRVQQPCKARLLASLNPLRPLLHARLTPPNRRRKAESLRILRFKRSTFGQLAWWWRRRSRWLWWSDLTEQRKSKLWV